MSEILIADGFGNLSDGNHVAGVSREVLGEQWVSVFQGFAVTDRGDGRKWWAPSQFNATALVSKDFADRTLIGISGVVDFSLAKTRYLLFLYNTGGTLVGTLGINASGYLEYGGDEFFAGVVATCTTAIPINTPTHFEVIVTVADGVGGSVAFYLDGGLVNTVSGIDTALGTGNAVNRVNLDPSGFGAYACGVDIKLSDLVVHKATGGALGVTGVYYLPADADGADTDFTPSAGDNFECVDEIGPDDDTTYNESDGTAGHRDSLENGGIAGVTVISVGALVRAEKVGAGAATLLLGAIDGASEDQSAAKVLTVAYGTFLEWFDDAPAGGSWNVAKVSAGEVSYEVGA